MTTWCMPIARRAAAAIPADAVGQLPAAIDLIARKEAVILDMAKRDDFDINKLRDALANSGPDPFSRR